jgi:HD-like signal output (HDOD) protein
MKTILGGMAAMIEARKQLTLGRLQERIDKLPLLPDVVISLLRLDRRADDYFDKVFALLRSDPAFATRLLRYANSAAIAPAQPVSSLERALMLVGCNGAVSLVVAHSATQVFVPRHDWERDLWRHAFDVACLMRTLAPKVSDASIDPEQAYLFGLLHDIGRFVLYLEAPDELRDVDETEWDSPEALIEAERSICGFTHAELGYLAMRKWHLPSNLAFAVRHHHSPRLAVNEVAAADIPLIWLVRDADWISVVLAMRNERWRSMNSADWLDALGPLPFAGRFGAGHDELVALIKHSLGESREMQIAMGLLHSSP